MNSVNKFRCCVLGWFLRLAIFSSAWCYWTAGLLSSHGRPSTVRKPISRKPSSGVTPNFVESYLSTIFSDHLSIFFNILSFWFFIFVNMGPYGRKFSDDASPDSVQEIHSQKSLTMPGRVSTKVVQRISETLNLNILRFFFFVFINMEPYRSKSVKRHLFWKYTPDSPPTPPPKISCIHVLIGRVYTKIVGRQRGIVVNAELKYMISSNGWSLSKAEPNFVLGVFVGYF